MNRPKNPMKFKILVTAILGFFHFLYAGRTLACPNPQSLFDVVVCQNTVMSTDIAPESLSIFLSEYLEYPEIACTTSGASAQPAYPAEGDLRCFLIFSSKITISFNLVENLNANSLELSQLFLGGNNAGVVLGRFDLSRTFNLQEVLDSATAPIGNSRLTCASCHDRLDGPAVTIHGVSAPLLTPISINRTVMGGIPKHGQVPPEKLKQELARLGDSHGCTNRPLKETCRRIKFAASVQRRAPLE
jgi:hypothetical protein